MARGYTRRQIAEEANVSLKTIDNYVKRGVIKGRIQYIDGHGHMRVFTAGEIDEVKRHLIDSVKTMPESLRRYVYGDKPPEEETSHEQTGSA